MAKRTESEKADEDVAEITNYQDQPASQATTIRDATDDEKPDPQTVAQFEEIQS